MNFKAIPGSNGMAFLMIYITLKKPLCYLLRLTCIICSYFVISVTTQIMQLNFGEKSSNKKIKGYDKKEYC